METLDSRPRGNDGLPKILAGESLAGQGVHLKIYGATRCAQPRYAEVCIGIL